MINDCQCVTILPADERGSLLFNKTKPQPSAVFYSEAGDFLYIAKGIWTSALFYSLRVE